MRRGQLQRDAMMTQVLPPACRDMEQLTYDLAAERRRVRIGRKNKIIEVSRVRACQANRI
jgi:hypothetical protein